LNNVSVVSDATNSSVATIPVGIDPQGVAFDSGKAEIFVANGGSNNVTVVNAATNQVLANLPTGSNPWGVAYDRAKGEVFVTNFNSSDVSIFNDTTNHIVANISTGSSADLFTIRFQETGLPNGTNWSVALGGASESSIGTTIVFNEPNGTYSFNLTAIANYSANYSTPVVVQGAPVTVDVVFTSATYPVTFLEAGLPSGSKWTVTAFNLETKGETSGQSTGTTIFIRLTNGTYSLSAAGPAGYRVVLVPSELTISGSSPAEIEVTFTASSPSAVTATSLPWLTSAVLLSVATVGAVGGVWGYRQYRFNRWRSEALRWVEELNTDTAEIGRPPAQ
jgi:YVTN family beta-propeller protein